MSVLSITITTATAAGFTAYVIKAPETGLNRAALRRLILDLAAAELGTNYRGMGDRGYDVSNFDKGWESEAHPVPGGRRLIRFTVRPLTEREQSAILRERGGFVQNSDGSMGFVLPQPRAKAQPVQAKQRKPRTPSERPADVLHPERMARPRLK